MPVQAEIKCKNNKKIQQLGRYQERKIRRKKKKPKK